MSKKHYIALAEALRASKPETPCEGGLALSIQWRDDCSAVADVCARMNPSFDRTRFLVACGTNF